MRRRLLPLLLIGAVAGWSGGCQTQTPGPTGGSDTPGGDVNPGDGAGQNPGGGQTQPPAPASFVFQQPGSALSARARDTIAVRWTAGDPAGASTVAVVLVGPGGTEQVLFSASQTGLQPGSLDWPVPESLAAGLYRLRGSVRVGTTVVAQVFAPGSITVQPATDSSAHLTIVTPAPGSAVRRGQVAHIRWDDGNPPAGIIDVTLKRDGHTVVLARGRSASSGGDDDTVDVDTTPYPDGSYQIDAQLHAPDSSVATASAIAPLVVSTNQPPHFRWVFPAAPLSINEGTPIVFTWQANDADDAASLIIEALPIGGSGSSVLVTRALGISPNLVQDSQTVQTAQFMNGPTHLGDYILRATVSDGVNPPLEVPAPFPVSILARPGAPPAPPPNQVPTLVLDQPSLNRTVGRGVANLISVQWRATDDNCATPDNCHSAAQLSLYADPDSPFSPSGQPNGNERILLQNLSLSTGQSQFTFDAGTLPLGTFTLYGVLDDGINPRVLAVAPGKVTVVPRHEDLSNVRPIVLIFDPLDTRGISDGGQADVLYAIFDPDAGDSFSVRLVLDKDRIPDNDAIVPGNPLQSTAIPLNAIMLPPGSSGTLQDYVFVVNEDAIPPITETNALGEVLPYNLRLDVDDGFINPFTGLSDHKTSLYAPGGLFVLGRLQERTDQNVVDLRQIGRTVSGAVFTGFQAGDNAGWSVARVPDSPPFDFADELLIVARRGEGAGAAYHILGDPNRYNGRFSLNSVGITVPGNVLTNPRNPLTAAATGRLNSAGAVDFGDAAGPDIVVGSQDAIAVIDRLDDDPLDACDCDDQNMTAGGQPIYDELRYVDAGALGPIGGCPISTTNGDGLPNSRSDAGDNDFPQCINGQINDDLFGPASVNNRTDVGDPDYTIDAMGMAYFVRPEALGSLLIRLEQVGQGTGFPLGARLRGAWFESVNIKYPNLIDAPHYTFGGGSANNNFGNLVAPLGTAGNGPLLISAPDAAAGRGEFWIMRNRGFFDELDPNNIGSLPLVVPLTGTGSGRGLLRLNEQNRLFDYTVIRGEASQDRLGFAQGAGDLNNDGLEDIAAGAPNANRDGNIEAGVAYLVLSENVFVVSGDLGSTDVRAVAIKGNNAMDHVGQVQIAAGDVNGDGIADMIIGAGDYGPSGAKTGLAGIIYGTPTLGLSSTFTAAQIGTAALRGVRILGKADGDKVGASVAGVGDFNGDGITDVLVAAPGQKWPAANIAFLGMPLDGDRVTVTVAGVASTFEFDTDGSVGSGRTLVDITGLASPVTAEKRLRDAFQADATKKFILAGRVENQSTSVVSTNILSSIGDAAQFSVVAAGTSPNVNLRLGVDTTVGRTGVSYLLFGRTGLPDNLVITVPDDVLPSTAGGPKMRSLILVGPTPVLPGGPTFAADVAARVGDFDGDGFADIGLGAPLGSPPYEFQVGQFISQGGEVFVIYGDTTP
ncbi:MAG: integrin alpha [Phycisphaerae bacterium]